jgi:hypothetical protein
MKMLAVLIVGLALGVGGTLGYQAVTEDEGESTRSSFRAEARESLAEEWGDAYRECIDGYRSEDPFFGERGWDLTLLPDGPLDEAIAEAKQICRRDANTILP